MNHHRLATVLTVAVAASLAVAPAASAKTRKPECAEGIQWIKDKAGFVPAYKRVITNANNTPMSTEVTVSRSITARKKISGSVETSVEGGFLTIQASVKAQLGFETEKEYTTSRNITDKVTTKARYQSTYQYGAVTRVLTGILLKPIPPGVSGPPSSGIPNCNLNRVKTFTATLPTGAERSIVTAKRLRSKR